MRIIVFAACLLVSGGVMADTVKLHAAGSLKAALTQVIGDFETATGHKVEPAFGPSGLLRKRIEKGEPAEVFASANMKHPKALETAGKAGPVRMFARNKLCAIAQPGVAVSTVNLLGVLLDPKITVGTSTPKADPSGDYAWQLFAKADKVSPGAEKALAAAGRWPVGPRARMVLNRAPAPVVVRPARAGVRQVKCSELRPAPWSVALHLRRPVAAGSSTARQAWSPGRGETDRSAASS